MVLNNSELTLLNEFVDRDTEMIRFVTLLEDGKKPIMIITGDEGIGKTSVTVKLIAACANREVVISRVRWTENDNVNYLTIMRTIRDDLGDEFFQPFNDLVNFYSTPNYKMTILVENRGSITVAENMQVAAGAQVGDVAAIIVKDNKIELMDSNFNAAWEQRARLSDMFFMGLQQALEKKSLVLFIDQIDDMVEETRTWIWHGLVKKVQDIPLQNIRLVLCVDKEPELDNFVRRILMPVTTLPPLERAHVAEFLSRRGISDASIGDMAKMLHAVYKGNPRAIDRALLIFESSA